MAADAQAPKRIASSVLSTLEAAVTQGQGDAFVPELVSVLESAALKDST